MFHVSIEYGDIVEKLMFLSALKLLRSQFTQRVDKRESVDHVAELFTRKALHGICAKSYYCGK